MMLYYSGGLILYNSVFIDGYSYINGGSMYLFHSGSTTIMQSYFAFNLARWGGSIYVFSGGNSLFTNCTFLDNVASDSGGAIHSNVGSSLSIRGIFFSRNIAFSGGSIYVLETDEVSITNSAFVDNIAVTSGGALWATMCSRMDVYSSSFSNNSALVNGGAMIVSEVQLLEMGSLFLTNNFALASGGAVLANGMLSVELKNSIVSDNAARLKGGSISFARCFFVSVENSHFQNNEATLGFGSAMWISSSNISVGRDNSFFNNSAPGGAGTIFWEAHSFMLAPEVDETVIFKNNTALYGTQLATEGTDIRFTNTNDIVLTDYETSKVAFNVMLVDYYNTTVRTDSDSFVTMSTPEAIQCTYNTTAYVTGELQKQFVLGVANFSNLQVYCAPGLTIPLLAQSTLDAPDETIYLEDKSYVYFSLCEKGEIFDDVCVVCENGYTFTTGGNECEECPEHASKCSGSSIWLEEGYWRLSDSSTTLLPCPMRSSSCGGGNLVGDSLCKTGYEGPLCAV